jgi:hypothetical protein
MHADRNPESMAPSVYQTVRERLKKHRRLSLFRKNSNVIKWDLLFYDFASIFFYI